MLNNSFEETLLHYFNRDQLDRIQRTRIGIAGLGGLGSNCAAALVRSGFRIFTLCDFDVVEGKNLNRQFYFLDQIGMRKTSALKANLERINPDLDLKLADEPVTGENVRRLFSDCDVVVEGFDTAECKQLIAAEYSRSGKFFVCASGLAGWSDADDIITTRIHETFHLVGDRRTGVSPENPPCAPRVWVAAAKEANCILAWVLKEGFS